MERKYKALLLYPPLGYVDAFTKQIPLSLIYCATDAVKSGHNVEIIDFRIQKNPIEETLRERLTDEVTVVGISVMSGEPIRGAIQISKIVRKYSSAKIVWGGPHPTVRPGEIMEQDCVDFVIRGYGSKSFKLLLDKLVSNDVNYDNIAGLCYKKGGEIVLSEINAKYEFFDYRDIPYHLIESNLHEYFAQNDRTFPIYTAVGCPYKCAFCISPIWYKQNIKKWVPFEIDYVIEHIEYLIKKYDVKFFYLYDDDSFVNTNHFMNIAREIKRLGLKVKIGVRGIRVNELERIKDEEFKLLEDIGIKILHIGVESGSQKMLNLMKKGIRVEKSVEVNRRLAKFPNIIPLYNLLVGFPTETIDDLKETKRLMIQLASDNPRCLINGPYKFIPYPGSELYELAVKHGFKPPERLEDWVRLDQEKEIWMPWYTKQYDEYIKMLFVQQNILDNRFDMFTNRSRAWIAFFKLLQMLYMPIGKLRLRFDFTKFLIEYRLIKLFLKIGT